MSYILICFLESIIGIMYILLTLVNDRVLSLLNTIYNFNTKVWVIILLCVGGRAMGIHHSFFICLFLVAAVATEDLPASVQGTVLIFFLCVMGSSSIMAVRLYWLAKLSLGKTVCVSGHVILQNKHRCMFKSKIFIHVFKNSWGEHTALLIVIHQYIPV